MESNTEALRLPDPLLVRIYRAGRINDVVKVDLDDKRNVRIRLRGVKRPVHFLYLEDVGWVPDGACEGL